MLKDREEKMLITTSCENSVHVTVDKLSQVLQQKGIEIFARIDHAEAARENNLILNDEVLLIFGDPKVGTFLMQEKPTIGIDLPLKLLVWQDENKTTQLSYLDPVAIGERHGIQQHQEILLKMRESLANLAKLVSAHLS